MTEPALPDALPARDWTRRDDLGAMLAALDPDGEACRYVGGAVRDTLAGIAVKDVDIATILTPAMVSERLKDAGFRVVPTGIDHGTVTAVLPMGPIEITTLRRDVSTDGRRATVAFSTDWREDAARRDFTINALYADPATLTLFDYHGGRADLAAGRVRFIGDAEQRIREDYLRILRFFRFDARFGRGDPDADALSACARLADGLKGLSRERIAMELLTTLALPDPRRPVAMMAAAGVWPVILPELVDDHPALLDRLVAREQDSALPVRATTRLAALLPLDREAAEKVGARLRLSLAQRGELGQLVQPWPDNRRARHLAADVAAPLVRQWLALRADNAAFSAEWPRVAGWEPPVFPLTGRHIIARGIEAGPAVAKALGEVRRRWIAADFPQGEALERLCDTVVAGG